MKYIRHIGIDQFGITREVGKNILMQIRVDLDCWIFIHGLFRVKSRREKLIFDVYTFRSLLTDGFTVGDHNRDRFPHKSNDAVAGK